MNLEDLDILDQRLGEGGFGSVFVCKLGKKKVAAKRLSQAESEFNNLMRETSRLKRLEYGKHIAYTYEAIIKDENLYMVMEYCERGDLQNYLKMNRDSVTYEQKLLFCRGILLGLLYCHSMEIFHGDIKCSNVILGKDLEPKLTDFGLSMTVNNIEDYCKTYEGSIHWAAPELFSIDDEYSFKEFKANPYPTDVYSLGATFCQVSYDGTTDFIDSDDIEMDVSLGFVSPISKDAFLEEIVDGCCQFERNERISLDECLSVLDNLAEAQLPVPAIDDKWQVMQQDIQANSKVEPPPSFILHRPTENLVVGLSNLSLLEWLCINNCIDAVEYMTGLHKYDQDQIKWLYEISELCKSSEVADFLKSLMQNNEPSHLVLSNLIDKHPQQFIVMLIKAGASCHSYNLLKKSIKKHHNMTVQAIIGSENYFKDWVIHDAIKFGNTEVVKILVNAGADLGRINDHTGNALLKTAIDTENIEIVKSLLEFDVDVNDENDFTPVSMKTENQHKLLYLAALKGNREIVELLIKAGATMDIESHEWRSLSRSLEEQGGVSMIRFIHNSISKVSNPVESNPLCAAIRDKQPDLVQTFISDEENIDEIGFDGYAPLHWAVIVGDEGVVKALIKAGIDLDIKSSNEVQSLCSAPSPDYFSECTPLHIAVSKEHLSIAKVLIESGADFRAKNGLQQTILDIAKGNKKEIEKIITECAPIDVTSMRRAMKSISHKSIKIMIKNQQVNAEILSECLCIAASSGKNDLIRYLLECGANFNNEYQGKTPLGWAVSGGNIQAIKVLINAGADINARNPDGTTLLLQNISESNTEMVQFLVDEGADVNVMDAYGNEPICHTCDREIIKILINAGANPNAKNSSNRTFLIKYVKESDTEMVQFLVDKGADVNVRDKYGNTPIRYADDKDVLKILINAGADANTKDQYGGIYLIQYVMKSNIEMVQLLLDKRIDVNASDMFGNAPIHYAENGEIMEALINAGADINAKKQNGITRLIQHVKESDIKMVQFLVDKGADVNARDKDGNAPIHYANDKEIIEILTSASAKVNIQNENKTTLLFQHIRNSNAEMVQSLVDNGTDVNVTDKDGNMPIHCARNREIMGILINAGADINANDQYGETLLIQYIKELNAEMVRFLVNNGADVNARDKYGNKSINCTYDIKIKKILLNAGADINARNPDGTTLLIQNISGLNREMVQFLIDKGADVNFRDEYGDAPIHCAKSREIVEILINAGADINSRNPDGTTVLIQNTNESNAEMVQFLIDKGADVNFRDEYGNTPVRYVKNREVMEIFINAGADIDAKNQYGITLLIQNISESNRDMALFLIDKGADINARDAYGNTPIHYANDRKVIEILINAGANINAKNQYGAILLIQHVKESDIKMVQFLVDKGADVNARDAHGNAPIHYTNDKEVIEILTNAGAKSDIQNENKTTLLFQHIRNSNAEMVQSLVDNGTDVNVTDKDGNMPIHYANDRKIIEILINAGADINENNQHGETPLIQYIKESNAEMVRFLVENGADVNTRNHRSFTPIHYAKDREVAEILTSCCADINAKSANDRTPLFECVEESLIDMVQFLLDKEAFVNVKDEDGNAPIHLAKDKKIAETLINAGADIDAKNQYGDIYLTQNIKESNTELVQFLVDKGANVNARSKDGNAPIHHANYKGFMEILINAGADIDVKNSYGTTCLIQYVKKSNTEMVQFLVDKRADVNTSDVFGNTSIHYANDRKIIEILLNAGADINAKNQNGITRLIQHVKESDIKMVQFLVDKGADVNARDKDGNAPIHYANDKEIIETLINAGADINAKNQYGRTFLIESIRKSNTEMVQFLVDKGADVNARDKDGNAPIHFVRDKEIAEILITAGARINVKDRYEKRLFDILMSEQNRNLSNKQYERKKVCELLEYLRDINKFLV